MAASHKSIWPAIGLAALLALPSACGGGAVSGAKTPERDELGSDLEQKAAELEAELARLEGGTKTERTVQSGGEGGDAQPGGSPEEQKPAEPSAEPEASSAPATPAPTEETRELSPRERCKTACRALGSMERSAERICALVGEEHEKCVWARSQVKGARGRVEQAGCTCEK